MARVLVAQGRSFRFHARGGSMRPAIRNNDVLQVEPVRAEELRAGEIVLFAARSGGFRAHRLQLADGEKDMYVTKGDANPFADAPIQGSQILGRVVSRQNGEKIAARSGLRVQWACFSSEFRNKIPRLATALLWLFVLVACLASTSFGQQVAIGNEADDGWRLTGASGTNTFNLNAGTTANRVLVVGVSLNIVNAPGTTVSGVTYNGTALTLAGAHNDSGNTRRVEMWYLIAPTTGTHQVAVSLTRAGGTGNVGAYAGAVVLTGADQTAPVRSFVSGDGTGTVASLDVPSGVYEVVVDTLAIGGAQSISGVGTTQNSQWNGNSGGTQAYDVDGGGSTRTGAPSVPMSETLSASTNWSVGALSIRPAQADVSVTNVATSSAYPGNLSYTVTVTNNGPSSATGVTLTDTRSAGTYVSATPSQGSCTGTTTVTCSLGTIASGASATMTLVVTPTGAGGYTNNASLSYTSTDLNTANNSAIAIAFSQTAACATPATNGAGGPLTGVVNTYYPGTASVSAGAKTISLGAATGANTAIASGDLLLVIQMQGTTITSANDTTYGDGVTGSGSTALNNVGVFEFVKATSAVTLAGGNVSVLGSGPGGGLLYAYTDANASGTQGVRRFQVVRVPQYSTASLSNTLTALAWSGTNTTRPTGGILALDVAGALNLNNATVNLDGKGFRGGAGLQLNGTTGRTNTDFRQTAPTTYAAAAVAGAHGSKGEGIAGTPRWVYQTTTPYYLSTAGEGYPNGSMAQGAPGNAGGGGTDANPGSNDQNAGGAGGANGGTGGAGGNAWSANLSSGGIGGTAFPGGPLRLVLGGGGGAGSRNNSDGDNQASSGGAGGGIAIIRAGAFTGTGTISTNGSAAYNATSNDAGGGGGAGGSILMISSTGGEAGLTAVAHGGRGGDAWDTQPYSLADRHGPGGGGGGGVLLVSGGVASVDITGGSYGTTLNPGVAYGATAGTAGIASFVTQSSQVAGYYAGADCTPDLTITKSHTGNFTRGSTGSYTLTVNNISTYGATTGATVTVTDSLPAGLTPTAASGTGWSCSIASQTVTCTRTSVLTAGASYPAITVTASVLQAAANSVTNVASVSGGGQYNTTNDTASDPTTIVSSTDLSITKTGPSSVITGTAFNYTLTVTNGGPSNATGVVVTDTLPTGVTYNTYTATGGTTCTRSGVTVTCTVGNMNAAASVTITINVTAGAPSRVTNTASVTGTETDPASANNTASLTTVITYTTQVSLRTLTAQADAQGVLVEWKTGSEAHNLGFNVYREENGERVRLNPSLIAGSALTLRSSLPQHAAKSYAWLDRSAKGNGSYWLEDVDLDGTRTLHGPVSVAASGGARIAASAKTMGSNLAAASLPSGQSALARTSSRTFAELNRAVSSADLFSSRIAQRVATVRSGPSVKDVQYGLAARSAVKITVRHEGWYRVTQAELAAAGLNQRFDSRYLQLFAEGVEQPVRIVGADVYGGFGPKSAIEFYGTGIDTPYSDARVYWLVLGNRQGQRMRQWTGNTGGGTTAASFQETVELKQRSTYFAALLRDNTDNFFGGAVNATPLDQVLYLPDVAADANADTKLQVVLQGVTQGVAHSVQVSFNGVNLGDVNFSGQEEGTLSVSVPHELLTSGNNTVTLTALGGETDLSLVDVIRITYPRGYSAESDALNFTAQSGERISIQGFHNRPTRLVDITDPSQPFDVAMNVRSSQGSYILEARVPTLQWGTRQMLALADAQIESVESVVANQPSSWNRAQAGGEVVLLTNSAFVDQVAPLAQLRRSQGKSVAVVSVEDVYDEFNFGEASPYAVRDFLKSATGNWRNKPAYLLLVGDASVDPRNYLGFGYFDFVPTRIIPTAELKTASDDWFSDFSGNGLAQIKTGRLPVRTPDDANLTVQKIVNYEKGQASGGWTNQVLLVADQDSAAGNFTQQAQTIEGLLPASIQPNTVFTSTVGGTAARQQIVDGINNGQTLVNYNGHGSVEIWSGQDLLDTTSAASLNNGARLPVFVVMNCLNGFFHDVYSQSLAESLLLAKSGGAVAVWASSGLTSPDPQFQMDQSIVSSLFSGPAMNLGDAVQVAKTGISDLDVRRTFILFGDPLLQIKRPAASAQQLTPRPRSGIPAPSRPLVSPPRGNPPQNQRPR